MNISREHYDAFYAVLIRTVVETEFPNKLVWQQYCNSATSPEIWEIEKPGDPFGIGKMLFGREARFFYRFKTDFRRMGVNEREIPDDMLVAGLKYVGATLSSRYIENHSISAKILPYILLQFFFERFYPEFIVDDRTLEVFALRTPDGCVPDICEYASLSPEIKLPKWLTQNDPEIARTGKQALGVVSDFYKQIGLLNFGKAQEFLLSKHSIDNKEIFYDFMLTSKLINIQVFNLSIEQELNGRFYAWCNVYYQEDFFSFFCVELSKRQTLISNSIEIFKFIDKFRTFVRSVGLEQLEKITIEELFSKEASKHILRLAGYDFSRLKGFFKFSGIQQINCLRKVQLIFNGDWKVINISPVEETDFSPISDPPSGFSLW